MSKQKIKLEVEGLKMEPLKFFLEKEGKTLEKEIEQAFDEMYLKYVPEQMREYIDHQVGSTQEVEESSPVLENGNQRKAKNSQRIRRARQEVQPQIEMAEHQEGVQEMILSQQM